MTSIWNFIKRHRRKFVVVGVLVGGAVLFRRYAQKKMKEWQENETAACFDRLKREQHFESTQNTCRNTITGLIPNIEERILALLDCEATAELLSKRPANRIQLWEDMKCTTFARLGAEIYSAAILVTLLNVQLSVIGGYMFVDAMNASRTDLSLPGPSTRSQRIRLTPIVQQKYLTVVQHFLNYGIEKLVGVVCRASAEVISQVDLREELTIGRIHELTDALRLRVEDLVCSNPFEFALPNDNGIEPEQDLLHSILLNETRDLLESDDCKKVLFAAAEVGFSLVMDHLVGHFVNKPAGTKEEETDAFTNPNRVTMPMAKLIPIFASLGRCLYKDLSEQLVTSMFTLEVQQIMGANIYETFSQQ